MATLLDENVGLIRLPEWSRIRFLPGMTVGRVPGQQSIWSFTHRDSSGLIVNRGWSVGVNCDESLRMKWLLDEDLQRLYETDDDFLASFSHRLHVAADPRFASAYREHMLRRVEYGYGRVMRELVEARVHGIAGGERTAVGEHIVGKLVWNTTAPASTAGIPSRIALDNASAMVAHQDSVSLSAATTNSTANNTTNEFTTHGLARTGALTVTDSYAASLDGQLTETITNIFTETTGPDTVYGGGVMDNTTAAFNMYLEATATSAILQTSDTYTATATMKL